ncbi:hypothetical protein EDD18DRAFT_1113666 [Armillaria luteobubalina]|uniref:Uncharacterized protein n=1 Tax=Armillaria luteobubalina TaxID=153913 RepID=A0AA39TCH1_9AGAR|nr:hypothetical protein EDD18DRAFT_1113666 [Armillaria luteobubalina]
MSFFTLSHRESKSSSTNAPKKPVLEWTGAGRRRWKTAAGHKLYGWWKEDEGWKGTEWIWVVNRNACLEYSHEHAIVQTAKAHFKFTGGTRSLDGLSENGQLIRRAHDGGILLEDDKRVEDDRRGHDCSIERAEYWERALARRVRTYIKRAWEQTGWETNDQRRWKHSCGNERGSSANVRNAKLGQDGKKIRSEGTWGWRRLGSRTDRYHVPEWMILTPPSALTSIRIGDPPSSPTREQPSTKAATCTGLSEPDSIERLVTDSGWNVKSPGDILKAKAMEPSPSRTVGGESRPKAPQDMSRIGPQSQAPFYNHRGPWSLETESDGTSSSKLALEPPLLTIPCRLCKNSISGWVHTNMLGMRLYVTGMLDSKMFHTCHFVHRGITGSRRSKMSEHRIGSDNFFKGTWGLEDMVIHDVEAGMWENERGVMTVYDFGDFVTDVTSATFASTNADGCHSSDDFSDLACQYVSYGSTGSFSARKKTSALSLYTTPSPPTCPFGVVEQTRSTNVSTSGPRIWQCE